MRSRSMVRLLLPGLLAALVLAGASRPAHTVQARARDVLGINWALCALMIADRDWSGDGVVNGTDATIAFLDCASSLDNPATLQNLVRVLGGDPANPSPADFAAIDADAGQLHEVDGVMWVVAFVTNDAETTFVADKGAFVIDGWDEGPAVSCGPMPDHDFTDEDCDDDGIWDDGVVVVRLDPDGAARGPATVVVNQTGIDTDLDYTITGEPSEIHVVATEARIGTGAGSDCGYPQTDAEWAQALADPEKTVITAQIRDSDGTPLTAAIVRWQTDDAGKAVVAQEYMWTADLGAAGLVARNVLCGTDSPGQVAVTASISKFTYIAGTQAGIDIAAGSDSDSVAETVVSGAVGGLAEVPDTTAGGSSFNTARVALLTTMSLFVIVVATGGWCIRRRRLR